MPDSATRIRAVVASVGLATMVLGSFLPWLHSGDVQRNSYEIVALAERFDLFEGDVVNAALRAWIAVPIACTACVVAYTLSLRRTAAVISCILAVLFGTIAVLVAVQGGDSPAAVGVTRAGPVVTAGGAVLALAGSLTVLVATKRLRASRAQPGK